MENQKIHASIYVGGVYMSLFPESAYQLELPKMHRVLQKFDTTQVENVEETLRAEMHKKEISSLVKPGMRSAMAL